MKIRKKISSICQTCQKESQHYTWEKRIFCSHKCNALTKRIKKQCCWCNKDLLIIRSKAKTNKKLFCNRHCYDQYYDNHIGKKLKKTSRKYINLISNKSCVCGVKEEFLLQLHHIDGNPQNNKNENLEIVCANCHIKRHLRRLSTGEWVYHTKSLTPRNILDNL